MSIRQNAVKNLQEEPSIDEDDLNKVQQQSSWARFKASCNSVMPAMACGSGLFSDGYVNGVMSSVNAILAILYPTEYTSSTAQQAVNSVVFAGTVLGQLIFGYVSDKFSRKSAILIATIMLILLNN